MPAGDIADVTLTTDRLVIRRFRTADAGALAAYRSDPAVARYQSWVAPLSTEDAAELVARLPGRRPDRARLVPVRHRPPRR